MDDEETELAKWQSVCPELFTECKGLSISAYAVLNALQGIEQGRVGSVEDARALVLRQHKEKLAIRQRVLAAAKGSISAEEVEAAASSSDSPDLPAEPACAECEDDGEKLPAWVIVHAVLAECVELVWHALCTEYIKCPGSVKLDALDDEVKIVTKTLLKDVQDGILSAVAGREGSPAAELAALLAPAMSALDGNMPAELATLILRAVGLAPETQPPAKGKGRKSAAPAGADAAPAPTEPGAGGPGGVRTVAAMGAELRAKLELTVRDQLAVLAAQLADGLATATPLPPPVVRELTPAFLKELLGGFECAICASVPDEPCTTQCGHSFCLSCLGESCASGTRRCPICRVSVGAITRYVETNSMQHKLATLLTTASRKPRPPTAAELDKLREAATCPACNYVMAGAVSSPTGHSFCGGCLSVLAHGDGTGLEQHVPDKRAFKSLLGIRAGLKVNVALNNAVSALFPNELARLRPIVRKRTILREPLDGRKPLRLARPRNAGPPELSAEERELDRRRREEARIALLLAQGKDIFVGERDNAGMPDISHLRDSKGRPLKHNRSCHVCTQGNASWRGGFFQPLGCSQCPMVFCPRCLGNIIERPYNTPEGKAYVDQYIEQLKTSFKCVCCDGKCACQEPCFAPLPVQTSSAEKCTLITTVGSHPFEAGDKVRGRRRSPRHLARPHASYFGDGLLFVPCLFRLATAASGSPTAARPARRAPPGAHLRPHGQRRGRPDQEDRVGHPQGGLADELHAGARPAARRRPRRQGGAGPAAEAQEARLGGRHGLRSEEGRARRSKVRAPGRQAGRARLAGRARQARRAGGWGQVPAAEEAGHRTPGRGLGGREGARPCGEARRKARRGT